MHMAKTVKAPSDRTLNRMIIAAILVLAIGIPLVAVIYFMDRYVDPGPTLVERQLTTLEEAVRKTPNSVGLRLQLAEAYLAANRSDDALKQYDEVLKVDGSHRAALLGRGDVLLAKGDLAGAATSFQQIVDGAQGGEFAAADPQLAQAYYSLGSIALLQDRAKDAITALERAVRIEPTDADAWYLLGTASVKTGALARGVEALRKAILFVPTGWCEPYAQLSAAYGALGRTADAEYAGAMVAFCEKRPAEAKQRLAALVTGPASVEAMLGLGMIAEAETDSDAAASWYKKVLAVDATNFSARTGLNRLGVTPPPADAPHPSAPGSGTSSGVSS